MTAINRTIVVEGDSRNLTLRVVQALNDTATAVSAATAAEQSAIRAEAAAVAASLVAQMNYATLSDLLAETQTFPAGSTAYVRSTGVSYQFLGSSRPFRHYTAASGQGIMILYGVLLLGAGQSNMASSNPAAEGGDLSPDPRIRVWTGSSWAMFDPENGVGLWGSATNRNNIMFQAAKQALRDGAPCVYVIIDAHPGNTIDQWIANPTTGAAGVNWTSLANTCLAAVTSEEATVANVTLINGFVWCQGENNGGTGFNFDDYRARWDWLKVRLRNQWWFPSFTPITSVSMPPQGSSRVMDRFIKGYLPYDGDPYTSFTEASDQPAPADNLMHWTGPALAEIGRRAWANILKKGGTQNDPNIGPARYVRWHFEPVNGFGLGLNWVPGAAPEDNRAVLGSVSNASGENLAQPFMAFWRTRGLAQMAQHTEFLGAATLKSYTAANFASASHAVNTDPNKKAGTTYWDSVNRRLMVATGTGETAAWSQFNADATVTPT